MITMKNTQQAIAIMNDVESKDINERFIVEVLKLLTGCQDYPLLKDTKSTVLGVFETFLLAVKKLTRNYYYEYNTTDQMRCKLYLLTACELLEYINKDGIMFEINDLNMTYDKLIYDFIPKLETVISVGYNVDESIKSNLFKCFHPGGLKDIIIKFIN